MAWYRYRTGALAGPWRRSREEALADAVRANQADTEGGAPGDLRWLVPGRIEEAWRGFGSSGALSAAGGA